jgi:hypothetical protein
MNFIGERLGRPKGAQMLFEGACLSARLLGTCSSQRFTKGAHLNSLPHLIV